MKAVFKTIYLAGGCFWGLEKYLSLIEGVEETTVGYANGNLDNPSYEQVCKGDTGHAEAVRVVYDSGRLGLTFLLEAFYQAIDPTAVNRQGGDVGVQYRCGVYYQDPEDEEIALGSVALLQENYHVPLAIEVKRCTCFYTAEEYHQRYLWKNKDGYCHIDPALFAKASAMRDVVTIERNEEKQALKERLTDIQFEVTQNGATEPPFRNTYYDTFQPGLYVDVTTGKALFASKDKFDAGCGWPSFAMPIDQSLVEELSDHSHGRIRTEVRSAEGDAHLGHVFQDGPEETGGLRYCINSAALRFVPKESMAEEGYGEYIHMVE